MKKISLCWILCLPLWCVAQNIDQQRYMGLQFLNLKPGPTEGLDVIEQSIRNGCNLVAITVYWDEVYKTYNGPPDWSQYDAQMELIARMGAKAAVRVMVGRLQYRLNGFWTSKETTSDYLGRPLIGIYGRTCFSFAHEPTVTKAYDFIKEVCQRYNNYQNQGKILFVSFVNTPTQELGYHYETWLDGDINKQYFTGFDYSESSVLAFRRWIEPQYKSIQKLNYVWGIKANSFTNLMPPSTSYTPLRTYQTRAGKDWYLFGHIQLKKFIDGGIKVIKNINPNYKVVSEYAAITDELSAMRSTISFKDLEQNTDGTKINNDPIWSQRWVFDIARSNLPNRWLMSETFYNPNAYTDQILIKHFDEAFEAGCKVVTIVVSSTESQTRNIFRTVANRWLNNPMTAIRTTASMSYKVTEALDSTVGKFEKEWLKLQKPNAQFVNVQLNEDILSTDYWKPVTINALPIVATPINERATKPQKLFKYTLPKDVFTDPDGEIVKVEVIEKPTWLNFNDGVFSGTAPNLLGDNKITLRATDNEGGIVQTSFNLKVVNVNVRPIVLNKIPNFEAYYEQSIFYQFPGNIFDDPDGTIVRTEARGLRPWMTYTGKEFSAFPQEKGTFPITVRAYDDDSATVETTFNVKVLNRLPVVRQPLPEKVIAQNKAFRFRISTAIFADPDGQIARLEALDLPSWLSFNGFELTGTPNTLTTYRIRIRAYDDSGDWVETPFRIVVDTRANLNQPPVVRFKIPDVQLYVTQRFAYKVPDSLFFDTNGYVDRLEFPALPSWLTVKGNDITGLATQAGTYTVAIRAIDDDETTTTTTFTITVRLAQLDFQLVQAGKVGTRQVVGTLKNNDVWQETSLPDKVTIYAFCDAPVKEVRFRLSGPYQKSITATRFPYTLFDEETGFAPIAGTYTLEATAFSDSMQVSTAKIQFKVQPSQSLQEWDVYPNPFSTVCNIKLPSNANPSALVFRLVSASGQSRPITPQQVTVVDKVAYLNLTPMSLPTGTYFIQILENDTLQQVIKVGKL